MRYFHRLTSRSTIYSEQNISSTKVINMSIVMPYINEAVFATESEEQFALTSGKALKMEIDIQNDAFTSAVRSIMSDYIGTIKT